MDILTLAAENQQTAWQILKETGIVQTWEKAGATVNLVDSLKSGLLMKNRDIDMHIYTDKLSVAESFSVIQELAERLSFKEIHYKNLIDTEEECIEWHILYEHNNRDTWKFDMIHIRKGSRYDGTVERVTDAITERLTPEIRKTILQLKQEIPNSITIPGTDNQFIAFFLDPSALSKQTIQTDKRGSQAQQHYSYTQPINHSQCRNRGDRPSNAYTGRVLRNSRFRVGTLNPLIFRQYVSSLRAFKFFR